MGPPADSRSVTQPVAMRVWLLGDFKVSVGPRTIEGDAWRLRKAVTLVKLLALEPWPDVGRKAASNNLRQALHAARKAIDPEQGSRYLASRDEYLLLCPESDLWVDVQSFEEAGTSRAWTLLRTA